MQGIHHVLIVVHDENASAVRHGEASYLRVAGIVVKRGEG
jgi:hypothetical protein